jgi:hypothetical protein
MNIGKLLFRAAQSGNITIIETPQKIIFLRKENKHKSNYCFVDSLRRNFAKKWRNSYNLSFSFSELIRSSAFLKSA